MNAAQPSKSLGAKRILIVDDDKIVREMLELFLQVEGYEVFSASSGLKVINLLQTNRPDLVLLDIMMPWLDGYALCKAIKESEELKSIPVVFLSARSSKESIAKGFQVGCDAFFTKPLDMKDFSVKLKKLFEPKP